MKIIHLCMGFPVEYPGGITNYVRTLANDQAMLGHQVVVYSNYDAAMSVGGHSFESKHYNSSIRPFSLGCHSTDVNHESFIEILRNEDSDLIHIHSLLGIDLRFAKDFVSLKKKYVISLHDYNFLCPRIFMVDKNNDVCRSLDIDKCKSCVGYFDQIDMLQRISKKINIKLPTIKSGAVEQRFEEYSHLISQACRVYPVSARVGEIFSEVTNGNFKTLHIGNASARSTPLEKIENDKIVICFLGTFTEIKGANVYIDICSQLDQTKFEFVLYGRGDTTLVKEFQSIGGIYKGAYSPKDLPKIMSTIDIGAVLSIWEDNGPQVVMEFINNNIPVIGTRRGGIPDFITENDGFVFEPESEIAFAVNWIMSHDKSTLKLLSSKMKKLTTPEEHASIMLNDYATFFYE